MSANSGCGARCAEGAEVVQRSRHLLREAGRTPLGDGLLQEPAPGRRVATELDGSDRDERVDRRSPVAGAERHLARAPAELDAGVGSPSTYAITERYDSTNATSGLSSSPSISRAGLVHRIARIPDQPAADEIRAQLCQVTRLVRRGTLLAAALDRLA